MEETFETSLNSQEFKCSKCKNPLSVAPILSIIELDSETYLCGRCEHFFSEENSNPKAERQTLYEYIAKKMKFTCRYQTEGCKKILNWDGVVKHEQDCEYRVIQCFFKQKEFDESEQCQWEGTNEEYFGHLEEHSINMDKIDSLRIWDNPMNQVIRIELFHNVLLVFLLFLDNLYHIAMIGKNKDESIKYRVEMTDETRENFGIFSKVSTFLPLEMEQIRKFGLKFNPNLLNPKFLSIAFINANLCYVECEAELLPSCDKCKGKLTVPINFCELEHKFCRRCFEITDKTDKKCPSCPYDRFRQNFLSKNKSRESKILSQHYKCGTQLCKFHGDFDEMAIHSEFCKFILGKCSKISRLNSPWLMSDSEFFFIFDNTYFKLSKCQFAESITLRIFSLKKTESDYRMTLDIFNSTFMISFVMLPEFDIFSLYPGNSVVVPKSILQLYDNAFGELMLKLNISKL